jgi:hypothetical protein
MKLILPLSALVLTLMFARLAHAWEPGAGPLNAARGGQAWAEVLADGPGASGVIHGVVEINAPPQKVWGIMNDCGMAKRLVANIAVCRVVKAGPAGAWDVREQVTQGGFLVPGVRNVFHNDYTPFSSIRFHRVEGDLKAMRGEWRLIALDGGRRTRVTYENHIVADFPGPAALVREAMRRDTPKVLMNLKRVCEGG